MRKVFLKLKGLEGESKSPRHAGAIEIERFQWGSKLPRAARRGAAERVRTGDLRLTKRKDRTSAVLWLACATRQSFAAGQLTFEDLSEKRTLVRSVIFELQSVVLESVIDQEKDEMITLTFQKMRFKQP